MCATNEKGVKSFENMARGTQKPGADPINGGRAAPNCPKFKRVETGQYSTTTSTTLARSEQREG
jgi:hypothetical protein